MTHVAKVLGLLALAGTVVPPLLFLTRSIAEGPMKLIMLISALVWFTTAPLWMKGGQ